MGFVWTDHAFAFRLTDPDRTSLTKEEIEERLEARKYVVERPDGTKDNLIWDKKKKCVINVPVSNEGRIITISPTREWEEWRLAEAERAWCPDTYWRRSSCGLKLLDTAHLWLARYSDHSTYVDAKHICFWQIYDSSEARCDREGWLNLMKSFEFRQRIQLALKDRKPDIERMTNGHEPVIHLRKARDWRFIPLDFFLNAP